MKQELKLKIKKILKNVLQWITIITGVIIAAKVVMSALNPKAAETIEDVKEKVEEVKLKIDVIEIQKEEIEVEHVEILEKKAERDKKAKKYFPGL